MTDNDNDWWCEKCELDVTGETCPSCGCYETEPGNGIFIFYSPGMEGTPMLEWLKENLPDHTILPR